MSLPASPRFESAVEALPAVTGSARHKVAFITVTTVFSGGDKHLLDLIARLDRQRFEPVIYCCGADNYSRRLAAAGVAARVETGFSRTGFARLARRLRRERPQTVAFVSGVFNAFPWYLYLVARSSGARVVSIFHNFTPVPPVPKRADGWLRYAWKRRFGYRVRLRLRARLTAACTHTSICVAEGVRRDLVEEFGFPPAQTHTVLNGVDVRYFAQAAPRAASVRRELGVAGGDVLIAAACRIVPAKGLDRLLDVLASLRQRVPGWKCVIVGDGPERPALESRAARLGLAPSVVWAGFQSDVRPYLQAADLFVNPSSAEWVECVPLAVLEAMASGLPCVAARTGGVPEIIEEGREGWLFAPGSDEELRAAIARLAGDAAGRRLMGERARERVQRDFDVERSMARILQLLLHDEERA